MDVERVCGTCMFGGDAYDRYGELDPNFVICQVKEAENRGRQPDRFQSTSGVTRMHYYREACLHWQARRTEPDIRKESDLRMQINPVFTPQPEPEAQASVRPHATQQTGQESEVKTLKTQVIQQEQLITSLQRQNMFLSEQIADLQSELKTSQQKLESLKPFDPAIFSEVNYFSLLGVTENASSSEIKEAYRRRMKYLHPDRYLNISQRLNTAYETLMDQQKRKQYLQQIRGNRNA